MDSGVFGDVSEEEGVRNIVIREVRELPTSSQCTGIVIGQVQREKCQNSRLANHLYLIHPIETEIRHINNDAPSANKRTHTCSSVHGSLGGEETMESEVWESPGGAGRSDTGLRPSTSFFVTALVAG